MSDIRNNVAATLLLGFLVALYFLPFIIALFRDHINTVAIFFTNLLLGATGIGWLIAFIWSWTN